MGCWLPISAFNLNQASGMSYLELYRELRFCTHADADCQGFIYLIFSLFFFVFFYFRSSL